MTDISRLEIQIDSGTAKKASSELDKLSQASKRTETAVRGVENAGRLLGRALGGLSAAALAREVIQTADAYQTMSARLALVTRGALGLEQAQAALLATAQKTRVGLAETADLFGSLSRSTQQLGVSQADVLGVTESINQAMVISGTSAQGAAAALTQLSQAFASGTLRGDELNSILEQSPRLAQAIADGMGVTVGQLRKLGQEGKLSAEKVFGAVQSQAQKLDEEFAKIPTTVGGAFQQVGNSLSVVIGKLNQATGATGLLARGLKGVSGAFDDLGGMLSDEGSQSRVDFQKRALKRIEDQLAVERKKTGLTSVGVHAFTVPYLESRANDLRSKIDAAKREADQLAPYYEMVDNETRRLLARVKSNRDDIEAGKPATEKPKAAGSGRDLFGDELRGLHERIALLGQETELERVNVEIKLGKYGRLTAAQANLLRTEAARFDQGVAQLALDKESDAARAGAIALTERANQAAQGEIGRMADQNAALRDEITAMGANAEAKAALEVARIRSIRSIKEEELAFLENNNAVTFQTEALRAQIALLKEREELLVQRGNKEASVKQAQDAARDADRASDAAKQLGLSFSSAFENAIVKGGDLRSIIQGLEQDILRIIVRKALTEPLAGSLTEGFQAMMKGGASAWGGGAAGSAAAVTSTAQTTAALSLLTTATTAQTTQAGAASTAALALTNSAYSAASALAQVVAASGGNSIGSFLDAAFGGAGSGSGGATVGGAGSSDLMGTMATFAAKGRAFGPGGIQAYAKGSVFNSPTMFKFAKGGGFNLGVMGEAGPEAVMPLDRASDGSLGVRMLGAHAAQSAPNVQIKMQVVNNASDKVSVRTEQDSGGNMRVLIDAIRNELGGEIADGRGLARPIGQRFGLNSAAGLGS